jgi:glutamate synthase domain-containing protein 2/glutamate synthase domain-containing protein 1/glutamate synthase domain-containing protein 3
LYDPEFEHDSCGVGFVCDIKGRADRKIVEQALEALRRMTHRGATGADPDTGDGAGILIQMPQAFFSAEAEKLGFKLPELGSYGAGLVFLPTDSAKQANYKKVFEKSCADAGLSFLGWRKVPVKPDTIGKTARDAMPDFEIAFASGPVSKDDPKALERKLYVARKLAEFRVRKSEGGEKGAFYVASFSSKTFVYKGMLTPGQVPEFFPDLKDPRIVSAIALIHSRYSTNTFPSWDLAQPFRFLAHNGEINTLKGNATWMEARQALLSHPDFAPFRDEFFPVIQPGGSDSAALDNALELLFVSGRSLAHSMMMLVPAAWEDNPLVDDKLKDFYRYHRCLTESWDGPAALAFTDGTSIAAALDRNGLRPARYLVTKDDRIIMASEMGVLDVDTSNIKSSSRLEPGKLLYIDTSRGVIVSDSEVKEIMANKAPYGKWVADGLKTLKQAPAKECPSYDDNVLRALAFNREELTMILEPMTRTKAEAVGSMGNDAPWPVLSRKHQPLFHYFRQLFAQVTNPPIDSIREGCVMSLETVVGPAGNILEEGPELAKRLVLEKPVFTAETLAAFRKEYKDNITEISLLFEVASGEEGFKKTLDRICAEAEGAIKSHKGLIVISDKGIDAQHVAIPSLIGLGAIHQHLTKLQLRSQASLFLESAEPRETHHFCVLFGYGADAVCPYGAYSAMAKLRADENTTMAYEEMVPNFLYAVEHGLMKVLSKMGISTLQSYKGAQIFEALGVGPAVVARCFTGTPSRIGGIEFADIARETLEAHKEAFAPSERIPHILPSGGFYKWRQDGEAHAWNPDTVAALQQAVRSGSYDKFKEYTSLMDSRKNGPITLRSLLRFKQRTPVPLEEVESERDIVKRFVTGAMSFGSISGPAHQNLAIAMNRLGGMSNTGEGGEDPERFKPLPNGDSLCSKVKQVASGRFGVTTLYLANAEELQIKIAQGAKPGEGGQLPGHKVSEIIAKTRYTTPGVTLISPPPHHDIYSIEDLAQLILDLKNVNPAARVSVKLVSEMGVGTVAAGVAKAKAEMILISGGDGGTGASPLSSVKYAGQPWELGLSETHQTLVLNGLRSRVRLQTDSGIRTGRDVVIAALLGAEEFGFATSALIASGCVMLRHCHLNNCSMGVATQDERCAARFQGKPEHVENLMLFIARQTREVMASLGFRTINEMVGQCDVLEPDAEALNDPKAKGKISHVDFSKILYKPATKETYYRDPKYVHPEMRQDLDRRLIELSQDAIQNGKPVKLDLEIKNTDRSTGAHLSGHIMKVKGEAALPQDSIYARLSGVAGQSFGAWLCKGVTFKLQGLANDYVGKGLFGGTLIITPAEKADYEADQNILIGNTALYGAISGELFVRGRAGERFCVRNSGATAVVEGVGDHGCEYMTGGTALILGSTGRNFAAGMSGGVAYVYDPEGSFPVRFNPELADLEALSDKDKLLVKHLLERHDKLTNSSKARKILSDFDKSIALFHKVMPRDYKKYLEAHPAQAQASKGGN